MFYCDIVSVTSIINVAIKFYLAHVRLKGHLIDIVYFINSFERHC